MSCRALRTIALGFLYSMLVANVLAADKNGIIEFRVIDPQRLHFQFRAYPMGPGYMVFRSAAEWIAFWDVPGRLSSPAHVLAPDVDFEHFTLLAVGGPKPTGGYQVSITSIREQAGGILVSVLDVGPGGEGCAVTSMVMFPRVFALIPKTDEPVRFQISQAKSDCNIPSRTIDGETS
jgi:hypothetical protein